MRNNVMQASPNDVKRRKINLKLINRIFGSQKKKIYLAIFLTILASFLSIIAPAIIGAITTKIILAYQKGPTYIYEKPTFYGIEVNFYNAFLLVLILYALSFIIKFINDIILAHAVANIQKEIRLKISKKINTLPLSYLDKFARGEILARVLNDVDVMTQSLNSIINNVISAIFTVIMTIIIMFTINQILPLIVILFMIFSIIVSQIVVLFSTKIIRKVLFIYSEINSHVEEYFSNHDLVGAFNYEKQAFEKYDILINQHRSINRKVFMIHSLIWPIQLIITNLSIGSIALFGGYLVLTSSLQIGYIQTFVQYSRNMSFPILSFANSLFSVMYSMASSERVFELIDQKDDINQKNSLYIVRKIDNSDLFTIEKQISYKSKNLKVDKINGEIEFINVNFSYDKKTPTIKNFNLKIKKGQQIAIVGPTGSGKTTIVNLLMNFYKIDSGDILIDGISIYDMNQQDLRRNITMVLQDTWLFKDSIYNNLKFADENASMEDIKLATKQAKAYDLIEQLPNTFEHLLEEEAKNLSQGQRQLLTIARAFIKKSPILILDEATSSVDTTTEHLIQEAMNKLRKDKTSLVIAHRLSTIKDCDKIVVLDKGNIVEIGSHDELLEKQGFYYKLYNSQFLDQEVLDEI